MHEVWKDLRSRIMDYLEKTTIADLVRALEEKRKALDKARRPATVGVAQRT
jgi:DNA-binding IscR family transcriptional regulator